jgi:hypothetical protein
MCILLGIISFVNDTWDLYVKLQQERKKTSENDCFALLTLKDNPLDF